MRKKERHTTTSGNPDEMLRYKRKEADKHLRQVFSAVWNLGRSEVHQIKDYINNEAKKEAVKNDNAPVEVSGLARIEEDRPINKRTIHRKLNELEKLGLVEHCGREYIVSDAWLGDLRYFVDEKAQEFGRGLLNRLTQYHYPTTNTFEVNIKKLIEVFGFFVLYCMLESSRPVPFNSRHKRPSTPNLFNDELAIKWSSNVFDPLCILNTFISAITYQISDKELEGKKPYLIESSIDDGFFSKRAPSTTYFYGKRILQLYLDEGTRKRYDDKKTKPMYLLSEETYSKILAMLEKLFPDYYRAAMFSRGEFFGRPKEFSLKSRYSKKTPLEVGENTAQ